MYISVTMKHTRKGNRMQSYDYSKDNLYFITSNVQHRRKIFGKIKDGRMILNEYGIIAEQQWHWLGEQYSYLVLHPFVVMPDHVHGIIEINRNILVGMGHDPSLRTKIKTLSELMGAYKTSVSKKIHLLGNLDFAWQRSFHDRIIRDEKSFLTITKYIENNPVNYTSS